MAGCSKELSNIYPDDVYIVVGESNQSVNWGNGVQEGDTSFTIPTFARWKVRLFRNGSLQFLDKAPPNGDSYFNYATLSGEFTLSQQAQLGETFIAQAYKPA